MLKNDFRRSLILLRPLRRGMSGHVRLERRTLQASMRFTVQGAAQGRLHALLLAQGPQGCTVYKLGALTTDSRGQSGLTATFDPRNIQGLDLNQYTLVVLVDDGAAPEMVLSGLVNGSKEIDWAAATQAAIGPYQKGIAPGVEAVQAVRAEAEEDAAAEIAEDVQAVQEVEIAARQGRCCCDEGEEAAAVEAVQAAREELAETAEEAENAAEALAAEADTLQAEVEQGAEEEAEAVEEAPVRSTQAEAEDEAEAEPETAAQPPLAWALLELDMTLAWPEEIAALKPLFQQNQATDSFALEDFVFVDAPLPAEEGAGGQCAIGLRARDGAPVSVCYALPGPYALEPPPGLEGYQYLGGWWYTVLEAQPEANALGEIVQ